jgi:iron complex transport system permease protein
MSLSRRFWILLPGLVLVLGILSLWALSLGAYPLTLSEIGTLITGGEMDSVAALVLWEIRLPRILAAIIIGTGLAVAGTAMQGLFRNPLADPGIIGVSAGGVMGAVLTLTLLMPVLGTALGAFFNDWILPLGAMLGAIISTLLILLLGRRNGQVDLVTLLLIGIAINALSGALVGLLTYFAPNPELRTFLFWSLGSLGQAEVRWYLPLFCFALPVLVILPFFARALNGFLLGEEDAQALGFSVSRLKLIIILLAAALVGAAVALCGIIGFIALVAPHMMRTLLGPDHRTLFPAAGLTGAILLLAADTFARTIAAPAELPVGALTALIGAPLFLWLLLRQRNRFLPG